MPGLQLTDIENEVIEHLGLDVTDLTGTWTIDKIDQLINRSYWAIRYNNPFREKEASVTFPTQQGIANYQIPTPFEAIRLISIEDINDFSHIPLVRETVFGYESAFVNDPTGNQEDKPVYYTREGAGIKLRPTPDQAYTVTVKYLMGLADLSTTNPVTPLPEVWHEIIVYGAVYRGYMRLGDFTRSQAMKANMIELLNQIQPTAAKEETDTHFGGVDVAFDGPQNPVKQRIDAFGDPIP